MAGELLDDRVIVDNPAEGSGVYNRGFFGTPRSGGGLELNLLEAVYLVEGGRLEVRRRGRAVSARELFRAASASMTAFEIRYLVYRDLRARGYVVEARGGPVDFQGYPRAGAQPPGDGVPVEGRARRGAERGHGPPDPTCAARQGGEGDPTRLRTPPASVRGSHEPRRHLEDRLQVRLPLPRLRGRPGDAPCEVSRPRGPERPPRRVAGNQPGGSTRSRGEEADPLRRSRGWRALREAGAREAVRRFVGIDAEYTSK